jgi:quercetin 2,3-dioxygenase
MKRREFIKNTIKTGAVAGAAIIAPNTLLAITETTKKTMKKVLHKAETRGFADHGWLKANHYFSFANYYDPNRIHFGVLRVVNDDFIAGGGGFPTHPHDNMEIITIPLEGDLAHKDSMGNSSVIKHGDIQVMSAGKGIRHSEFNASSTNHVKLFQIWLFPNKKNVTPRYDQLSLNVKDRENKLQQILSPNPDDDGVWIHQDAWFYMGKFDNGKSINYAIKRPQNGVYAIVVKGEFEIEGEILKQRDAIGIYDTDVINIVSKNKESEILLMDIPMEI